MSAPIERSLGQILLWFSPLRLGLARPERLIGRSRPDHSALHWTLVGCVLLRLLAGAQGLPYLLRGPVEESLMIGEIPG